MEKVSAPYRIDRRVPGDEEFKCRLGAAAEFLPERQLGVPGGRRGARGSRWPSPALADFDKRFTFAHPGKGFEIAGVFLCWRTFLRSTPRGWSAVTDGEP